MMSQCFDLEFKLLINFSQSYLFSAHFLKEHNLDLFSHSFYVPKDNSVF